MRIGIDLGGTKIECVTLDDAGQVLFRRRIPTPRHDYDATLRAIAGLVKASDESLAAPARGVPTVGIGMPGAVSPATGLIKNANSTWLNGRPFGRDLEAMIGRPVRLANDANCLALSEAIDGAAAGARVVFGVIIGTGTGGGIVVDGRVLTGPNAVAGEWGHNPLPWPQPGECPGPPCYCGRSGCIETFLSGPGLARDYRASWESAAGIAPADPREAVAPPAGEESAGPASESEAAGASSPDAVAIAALAAGGDAAAEAALRRYVARMARALASVINLLDPDVIVLGGGMSNLDRLYTEVPRLWRPWVFSDRVDTALLQARHGDASGVRGAARLWP